jgi:outer membrane protein assembly factor BamB
MNQLTNLLVAIAQVGMGVEAVHADPRELDDGSLLFSAMGAVQRLDAATGKTLWKTKTGNSKVLTLTGQHPGVLYVGSEEGGEESPYYSTFHALDLETGSPAWEKPQRYRGALNPLMISTGEGLIVSERTQGNGRIRLLDYDSGSSLWGTKGRGIKARGGIVDYAFTDAGLVVTTGFDSSWNDKGTEYLLYVIDESAGDLRFKDPLKVKGRMLQSELLAQGLLYVTTHEVNVFDPATGTLVHEPLVRSKRPIVTRWTGDQLYAFNSAEGQLYRLDRNTAALERRSAAKVSLQGKDQPMELDIRDDGIVLTGRQSVVGFDDHGEVVFNAYHPAPKHHRLVQALMWAQAVRAAMASVDYGSAAVALSRASAETEEGTFAHELTSTMSEGFTEATEDLVGIAGQYAREARRRFQASKTARDFVFMMVRDDNRLALAQVSKRDGSIVATIDLGRDKEPSYQVDDVSNRIFYRPRDSSIVAYDFTPAERVAVTH